MHKGATWITCNYNSFNSTNGFIPLNEEKESQWSGLTWEVVHFCHYAGYNTLPHVSFLSPNDIPFATLKKWCNSRKERIWPFCCLNRQVFTCMPHFFYAFKFKLLEYIPFFFFNYKFLATEKINTIADKLTKAAYK